MGVDSVIDYASAQIEAIIRGEIKALQVRLSSTSRPSPLVSLKLTEDEKPLHRFLILTRNKTVAHSDADHVKLRRLIFRTQIDEDRDPFDSALPRYHEGITLTYEQCRFIQAFLHRAIDVTIRRVQELKDIDGGGFYVVKT